jgi:5-methylthioadenosine/S-adenosylhomocysteine deaminase
MNEDGRRKPMSRDTSAAWQAEPTDLPGTELRIEHGILVAAPGEQEPVPDGCVVVRGSRIEWVGPADACPPADGPVTTIEASRCAILPGLVDTHAHFRGFRALGDGLGFMAWHDRYVHRFAEQMTPDDAYFGAMNTFMEMLRNGITAVQGMSGITVVEDREIQAAVDSGIRARIVPHIRERDDVEATIDRIQDEQSAGADRVRTWLGVEVPQLADQPTLSRISEAAADLDVCVHTHFSEVSHDSVQSLRAAGLLRKGLCLAHCVYLEQADIDLFARTAVSVAHNPRSNSRYGNGIAPLRRLLDAGVQVGLGTDAPDSTFSCDLLAEAQAAALLARASARDPQALSSGEALRLATSGGAAALGMEDQIGRLVPGGRADIIIVDLSEPSTTPVLTQPPHLNVLPLILFGAVARDVRDVLVDGQVVLRDRAFTQLDRDQVVAECQQRAERILALLPG